MTTDATTAAATACALRETLDRCLRRGLCVDHPLPSPPVPLIDPSVPHAPIRTPNLTDAEFRQAVKNALRYFKPSTHAVLGAEFAHELRAYGHIYMYRFRPTEYAMRAYAFDMYPARSAAGRCLMLMLMNNLDPAVAQFPHELITYGGNGSVLSNWAQYHLLMKYLCELTDDQTLSMYSGHPMGVFPSPATAPRLVITNGMVVPNYSSKSIYDKMYAMGVSQYGQMTAGSYCYIGPQGIVHGTTITLLAAARKYLQAPTMAGRVYVSSGLGGMSGAQGKAGVICAGISVLAEVDEAALDKRLRQGWVTEKITSLDELVRRIHEARERREIAALAYLGNIVDVWERLAVEQEMLVDLGSDQTSCHNPFGGGYYPVTLSFAEAQRMMRADPDAFKQHVQESLCRQVVAINKLTARGMRWWDYGNSFMLEAYRAGADIVPSAAAASTTASTTTTIGVPFRYPTYIQEFVGDVFSLGFGPFRWVCCSGREDDLALTDQLAEHVLQRYLDEAPPAPVASQLADNLMWIRRAAANRLVVGSQARILYADARARVEIAEAFNAAVAESKLHAPVVLSRDHHDVSGTDSPYRETSNIEDGSMYTADMSVHNVIGDAARGATWVALHNGGGCGWGEVMNGGFGMVLDGSGEAQAKARSMLAWDVCNGVTRRTWAGNANARLAIERSMAVEPRLRVTLPEEVKDDVLDAALATAAQQQ